MTVLMYKNRSVDTNGRHLLMDQNKLWNLGENVTLRKCIEKHRLFTLKFPKVSCPQPCRACELDCLNRITRLKTITAVFSRIALDF